MTYLITGSAGFIGFHLAQRLLSEGHRVIGVDAMTPYYDVRLKEARHDILRAFEAFTPVIGALEDPMTLEAASAHGPFEVIIHLAAQAGVRYSTENPSAYIDANVRGSLAVLEFARHQPPRHLLLASTSSIYGANGIIPFAESDKADQPLSLYAATKTAMEAMAHAYAHLYRIPTTAFRFFTVYGPWGRPDMALFKFVDAILNGRPIDVYGHGRMERDFTYIDDLIEAVVRLVGCVPVTGERVVATGVVDTLSDQAPYRVINIGGGQPQKLLDFVDTIEATLGQKAERRDLPMQPGDVPRTYASADLLTALTGYRPDTSLATGVAAFVSWYRAYFGKDRNSWPFSLIDPPDRHSGGQAAASDPDGPPRRLPG